MIKFLFILIIGILKFKNLIKKGFYYFPLLLYYKDYQIFLKFRNLEMI